MITQNEGQLTANCPKNIENYSNFKGLGQLGQYTPLSSLRARARSGGNGETVLTVLSEVS